MNMLAMCGKAASMVVSICDCTSHMVVGGKKMLSSSWSTSVTKWMNLIHQEHLQTVSFFDRAANIQKAGAILCAKYP